MDECLSGGVEERRGGLNAFFKQINLSHCAQAHLGLKSIPNFFFFLGLQIGWLQPLLYLNFELNKKNLKNLIFSPKK